MYSEQDVSCMPLKTPIRDCWHTYQPQCTSSPFLPIISAYQVLSQCFAHVSHDPTAVRVHTLAAHRLLILLEDVHGTDIQSV